MDSGEALDDDSSSSQVAWLQGGMLPTGSLAIVFISNHHPVHSVGLNFKMKIKKVFKCFNFLEIKTSNSSNVSSKMLNSSC